MISTSWSMPDSPGNSGWPSISSAITQPVDHTSASRQSLRPYKFLHSRHTNLSGVVGSSKDQLRCTVVARANVRHIGLVFHQNLRATEIAELQDARMRIQQQVLWLDVSVADSLGMDVGERAEELVDVQLDLEDRHGGLELVEMAAGAVDGLRHILKHQIQIYLILLCCHQSCCDSHEIVCIAYPVSIRVVESLEFDDVRMPDNAHDLELSILGRFSIRDTRRVMCRSRVP